MSLIVLTGRDRVGNDANHRSLFVGPPQSDTLENALRLAAAEFPALATAGQLVLTTDGPGTMEVLPSAWKLLIQHAEDTPTFYVHLRPPKAFVPPPPPPPIAHAQQQQPASKPKEYFDPASMFVKNKKTVPAAPVRRPMALGDPPPPSLYAQRVLEKQRQAEQRAQEAATMGHGGGSVASGPSSLRVDAALQRRPAPLTQAEKQRRDEEPDERAEKRNPWKEAAQLIYGPRGKPAPSKAKPVRKRKLVQEQDYLVPSSSMSKVATSATSSGPRLPAGLRIKGHVERVVHVGGSESREVKKPRLAEEKKVKAESGLKRPEVTIVLLGSQKEVEVKVKLSTPFGKIMKAFAKATGACADDLRFTFEGNLIQSTSTPASLELKDDDQIWVVPIQCGGKPVIYAFAPRGTTLPRVDVKISLAPSWEFSAIYPFAPIAQAKGGGTSTSWTVSATDDSTLVNQRTQRTVSSLFWEAHTTGTRSLPPSPPLHPSDVVPRPAAFDPSFATVDPSNSILLPWDLFEPYLFKALEDLTLHVAARTEMMTYWLPAFLAIATSGKELAMRFLPQAEYEQAAQLEVAPKPDVVTRVFMLFRGVEPDAPGWEPARERVNDVSWSEVVGVQTGAAMDKHRFRVLEWGGMEVLDF